MWITNPRTVCSKQEEWIDGMAVTKKVKDVPCRTAFTFSSHSSCSGDYCISMKKGAMHFHQV
jgi:hypothetical protein